MGEIVIQYLLIVLLVVGLGYLVYLLRDNNIKDDYFGLTYAILNTLNSSEAIPENIKKIIRLVSEGVKYVEDNFKNVDNEIKEERALRIVKQSISSLGLESPIDDKSIIYLIRLAASMLPPTNKEKIENKEIEG